MDEGPGRRLRLQGPEDPERRREPDPGPAAGTGDADRGPRKLRRESVPGASGRELGRTPGWTPTQHESNVSREQDSAGRAGLPEIGLLAPPRHGSVLGSGVRREDRGVSLDADAVPCLAHGVMTPTATHVISEVPLQELDPGSSVKMGRQYDKATAPRASRHDSSRQPSSKAADTPKERRAGVRRLRKGGRQGSLALPPKSAPTASSELPLQCPLCPLLKL
ncbi:hypothetical protein PAL_GLEAN10004707 [Pteropus alecto]|uniref:Uncharacterized protein n=1 Tax=Pteropus alecto TaxID=9402 RepID=L5KZP5_PTEAL|nr:hypothetical protein PAL_GLEAN10004707 [Pteropus alecto]